MNRTKSAFCRIRYASRWGCNFLLFSLTRTFGVHEAEGNRSGGLSRESREADGRTDSAQCEHPPVAVQIHSWVNIRDLWKHDAFLWNTRPILSTFSIRIIVENFLIFAPRDLSFLIWLFAVLHGGVSKINSEGVSLLKRPKNWLEELLFLLVYLWARDYCYF